MRGIAGRPGWAWIFILEGLFTVLFGLSSFFLLPRSPAHAFFFDDREKDYVIASLRKDGSTSYDERIDAFSWVEVGRAFKLPQVWFLAVIFFFDGVSVVCHCLMTSWSVNGSRV
jgi:hypothetical protein